MGFHHFQPFVFDSEGLQLRKLGHRLKLQRKPALILAALLEHPGEPIARKTLQARLWPVDTFVDFDLSLNVAVKKLRDCLGDSAEEPRFIETVSGIGYRFIGALEHSPTAHIAEPNPTVRAAVVASAVPVARHQRIWKLAFPIGTVLAAAGLLVASRKISHGPVHYTAANFRQVTRSGTEKTPFATDGERIYFYESRENRTDFTQVSVNGGGELRIPASADVLPYQADVRGDQLVYLDGNWSEYFQPDRGAQVWIRQLPAGTSWQVPDTRCQSISWTRDGHLLCTHGGEFRIIDFQGHLVRKLFVVAPNLAFHAHFSPDEKRIRFDMARTDNSERTAGIWEAAPDGSKLHLVAPRLLDCCGSWSSDGSTFVFEAWNGARWDIWALADAGWPTSTTPPMQLTSGPLDARYPKMSADGKEVFFMGADFRGELSTLDEKSGNLVPYLRGESITQLDFSRDGKWITYVAYPEGTLWRSRPDGSERLQLTRPPILPYNPRFSSDGSRIFFGDIGGSDKIYGVRSDGGTLAALSPANAKCLSPGSHFVDFPFLTECPSSTGETELHLIDTARHASRVIPGSERLQNAMLSSDAQAIAGVDLRSSRLRVFDIKSETWTEIPIPTGDNPGALVWSPKRDSVYLRQGETILRCWIGTRRTELVARLPKSPTHLWWGDWFGVSPDGKLIITRQTGAGDIYAFELQNR